MTSIYIWNNIDRSAMYMYKMDSGFDQCPYFCTKLITGNITLNQTAALCFVVCASATVCAAYPPSLYSVCPQWNCL